jgi:5-methylcytosine-specific restriction protein A
MPYSAPKPCRYPGCPALVRDGSGYCPAHKVERGRAYDERRGSSHERGYGAAWQRYSRTFLQMHPVCCTPGCNQPSEHTDHIKAVSGPNDPLFWLEANHQPLCHSCHSRKTATVDRVSPRRSHA